MTNYTVLLKNYDLKVTPQRVAIVEELYLNGHMNIDDLYHKLLAKFPSISLATIYKNINAMVEKVFLSEVKVPNAKSVFELVKEEHAHLVCSECGNIEDVSLDISSVLTEVTSKSQFKIDSTNLVLSGLCCNCNK
ncbi:Fur family transcriptional regulator [Poseidonibacter ostreae]|jgi:Fur family transcriptional regulator, peroxide stress response regulator|uniref:Transcriptional repressor n=1 Tax=Poseidonibacter ostreae TaxID=2654171 RepID=A0A6L4WNV6_9BACT|nr:Fur family transcriptional regulator [Poseidonibacter ostreae]KAB7885358.1 transcriptional repressor [Poseidonibacter ostreae]KAB7885775.1 transcriptional repressor [Poseidonibacter ostreae]KAB7892995.1 transcriptional repressor [Poseidonibacter ostreae]MAC85132.1 transcriptional repressor [Arcobacter sp.]|tara:strand:+ start:6435 stop:6839 length:405 start_codon:yes stop_codon:yes gene_type:complete